MRINWDAPITDLAGNEVKDGAKPVTLATVACNALIGVMPGDDKLSAKDKMALYRLAVSATDGGEQHLDVEQIVILKDRIANAYNALIVGRCFDILEQAGDPKRNIKAV